MTKDLFGMRIFVRPFLFFVLLTMLSSVVVGATCMSVVLIFANGFAEWFSIFLGSIFFTAMGALVLIPVWFAIFVVPSLVVFFGVYRMALRKFSLVNCIRLACVVTTAVAAWVMATSKYSVPIITDYVAVSAVLISPFLGDRVFRATLDQLD